ncbi:serine protease 52-like [Rhinoraja longicauda]
MGTINLRHNDGERHRVSDVWPHPNFNKTTFEDDVALLLVKPRIRFGDNLEPVWLAADTLADIRSWAPCYVIGWGVTRNEKRPSMLQEVEVKLIDCGAVPKMDAGHHREDAVRRLRGRGERRLPG